ncbi:MAG: DUF2934 domain-containing protein [Planctomycetales bacterium]|nr:DUF2934 domain-containing protein [Planctomycetales bacterium]
MSDICLDTLFLTDEELANARQCVERMAYFMWQDGGCPDGQADRFWRSAERKWIAYYYVPHREYTPAGELTELSPEELGGKQPSWTTRGKIGAGLR